MMISTTFIAVFGAPGGAGEFGVTFGGWGILCGGGSERGERVLVAASVDDGVSRKHVMRPSACRRVVCRVSSAKKQQSLHNAHNPENNCASHQIIHTTNANPESTPPPDVNRPHPPTRNFQTKADRKRSGWSPQRSIFRSSRSGQRDSTGT